MERNWQLKYLIEKKMQQRNEKIKKADDAVEERVCETRSFACSEKWQISRNKRGSTSISAGNEQRVPFLLGEAQEYKEFSRKADIIPIVSVHCRTTNRKSKRVNIHQKKKKKKIDPRTEDVSDDASLSLIQPKKTAKEANEEEENITFDTFVCSFIQKCTTVDRYTQTATVSEVQSKLDAFIASIKARE